MKSLVIRGKELFEALMIRTYVDQVLSYEEKFKARLEK